MSKVLAMKGSTGAAHSNRTLPPIAVDFGPQRAAWHCSLRQCAGVQVSEFGSNQEMSNATPRWRTPQRRESRASSTAS